MDCNLLRLALFDTPLTEGRTAEKFELVRHAGDMAWRHGFRRRSKAPFFTASGPSVRLLTAVRVSPRLVQWDLWHYSPTGWSMVSEDGLVEDRRRWFLEGRCPCCGAKGEFKALAPCCPTHGPYEFQALAPDPPDPEQEWFGLEGTEGWQQVPVPYSKCCDPSQAPPSNGVVGLSDAKGGPEVPRREVTTPHPAFPRPVRIIDHGGKDLNLDGDASAFRDLLGAVSLALDCRGPNPVVVVEPQPPFLRAYSWSGFRDNRLTELRGPREDLQKLLAGLLSALAFYDRNPNVSTGSQIRVGTHAWPQQVLLTIYPDVR